jgi:hypothetical protein
MIKKYSNLFNFIRDLPTLTNCLIILSEHIKDDLSMLNTYQYKSLKERIVNQKIKIVFEKEKKYGNIQKTI